MADETGAGAPQESSRPKRKRGPNKPKTVEVPISLLDTMQRQIQALQQQVAAQAARPSLEEVDAPRETPDGKKRRPGEVINISPDPTKIELRQVRWTKKDVWDTYPLVEVNPEITLWVAPHGVGHQFLYHKKEKVPSIFVDVYEEELRRRENPFTVPGLGDISPLQMGEDFNLAQRAVVSGQQQTSRVHFLGTGLTFAEQPEPATKTS